MIIQTEMIFYGKENEFVKSPATDKPIWGYVSNIDRAMRTNLRLKLRVQRLKKVGLYSMIICPECGWCGGDVVLSNL